MVFSVRPPIIVSCKICGKEFSICQAHYERGQGRYCSRVCRDEARKKRTICKCETCGKEFTIWSYKIKHGRGRFCSQKCSSPARSEHWKKDNNPRWNGGTSVQRYCEKFNESLKEEIRGKFERTCYNCGKSELDEQYHLSIHHIDYNKMQGCNGRKWCLIPLCMSCHNKTHFNRWYWFNKFIYYWAIHYWSDNNGYCMV